ncbi:hypothetical protein F4774DRAFT_425141 [Daldinia eschscholtzii]|nr:hypothetical protein F4774DRAFT_425141 [Daldinia eschscholtzii]
MSYDQPAKSSRPRDAADALQQLDKALANTMEEKGFRVVALTSDIGTGKSTSIIGHIWGQAKVGKAPPKLVYVVSTDTEVIWLLTHLVGNGTFTVNEVEHYINLDGRPVAIRSMRQYLAQFDEFSRYTDCTVVIDVNWYPTVEDEVAFARLLSWLAAGKGNEGFRVCCVLFMSAFESQRTVAAFEKWVGNVLRLDCTGIESPEVDIETAQEGWKENLQHILLEVLQKKRVVVGTERFWEFDGLEDEPFDTLTGEVTFAFREDEDRVKDSIQSLKAAPLVAIDADTPFSASIAGLGIFISPGVARKNLLVPGIMQVVMKERNLRWYELLRHYSWVTKSSESSAASGPSRIRFLCPASEEELQNREEVSENLGLAWNGDFMFTVLAFFCGWPGCHLSRIPMRRPANDYVFAEAVNRLFVLGCIQKNTETEGTYECASLGAKIMENFLAETERRHDFHLTYLLSRVQLRENESPEVRRIVARLVAVAYYGPRKIFSVGNDNSSTQTYRDSLPAVISGRAHAGALWVGVGICAALEAVGVHVGEDIGPSCLQGCFLVSVEDVRKVIKHAKELEKVLGLEPANALDWINQPLTEAQLRSIDGDMMWAWLHRIGLFQNTAHRSGVERVVDCVSLEEFQANMKEEPLRAQEIRVHCWKVTTGGGDFNAFYLSLEEEEGQTWARDLTWVPPEALQDIPTKTNIAWPEVVAKTF